MPAPDDVKLAIGGLFRCCIQTIQEYCASEHYVGSEGEKLTCYYCKKETIVLRQGVWQWVGMENLKDE